MKMAMLLVILFQFVCHTANALNALIVNGQKANGDEFENILKLGITYRKDFKTHCTSTVIASRTILTAGHCMEYYLANPGFKEITLNDQPLTIKKISTPPGFAERYNRFLELLAEPRKVNYQEGPLMEEYSKLHLELAFYDFALVETRETLNSPQMELSFSPVTVSQKVVIAGYGYTKFSPVNEWGWGFNTNDGLYFGYNEIVEANSSYYSIEGNLLDHSSHGRILFSVILSETLDTKDDPIGS